MTPIRRANYFIAAAVVRWDSHSTSARSRPRREIADMINPRQTLDQGDEADLPDDLLESIEDTSTDEDDFGDETQRDEELAAEAGLEQDDLIDPRGEDTEEEDAPE